MPRKPSMGAAPPALTNGLEATFVLILDAMLGPQVARSPDGYPAVPWADLRARGVLAEHLRRLLASGHLEHRTQGGRGVGSQAAPRLVVAPALGPDSGIALTAPGRAFARQLLRAAAFELAKCRQACGPAAAAARPVWDAALGELWWRGELVKQFRHDAANQRCLLDAFQDHGWPRRIDDPLPTLAGVHPKRQLRQTIESLNGGLRGCLRFHGDGTGRGVRWRDNE